MVFRAFFLLGILGIILLNTAMCFLGFLLLLFLTIRFIFIRHANIKWRKQNSNQTKYISFGIKSMKIQKENFKIINLAFRYLFLLRVFFKKLSIIYDDLHALRDNNKVQNNIAFAAKNNDANPHIHSPIYSHFSSNIYHDSE